MHHKALGTDRGDEWWEQAFDLLSVLAIPRRLGQSFSGHERNHLFLNVDGQQFAELSGISNVNDPGDPHGFVYTDYDHDGWLDIVLVNKNPPLVQLFRNQLGDRDVDGRMLAIRMTGANDGTSDSPGATRDAAGARVTVEVGELKLVRENRIGEGWKGRMPAPLYFGIGSAENVERVTVRWPSGLEHSVSNVPPNSMLQAFEDVDGSPRIDVEPYGPKEPVRTPPRTPRPASYTLDLPGRDPGAQFHLYKTTATWCEACRAHLPKLAQLRESFTNEQLATYGIPVDAEDTREMLEAYVAQKSPAYTMLLDLPPEALEATNDLVLERLYMDSLPTSILTDHEGGVLHVQRGLPSLSQLRRLMQRHGGSASIVRDSR